MPVNTNAHHTQFPATPLVRTMSVTRFGVSELNVVATIEQLRDIFTTSEASAKEALPFNRPVAIRLAEDVRDNLRNLLQDNILQDRTLLAKHGLDNTVLLAQRKKAALSTG